ncbi:MAG TPA: choline dehydrogenase [Candidatus Acidoferrales bacterium]|nr:choline dehydrogenase [Candidatus Acidoferrales bacterium]
MYDYIIVGAGTAGCVLASRLTEDRDIRVLLLEAGGPERRKEIRIPLAFSKLFRSEIDWNYSTEPEPHLANRCLYWPRGKVLGGSSSMNAMIYIRGNPADFDHWRDLGNTGWDFADVLPYFKRAENQQRGASEFHGVGGPLDVCDLRDKHPLARAFVAAAEEIGFSRNDDFNGASQEGVGFYQVTQRRGRRWSAADAYLRPLLHRHNLSIETRAQASEILFDKNRAVGVRYFQHGALNEARATREVILAGGAVNSPQLLLLSGIGPADSLRKLGIDVVADLPGVGENLQDHLVMVVEYECTKPITLETAETLSNYLKFLLLGRGPLTSNVAEAGIFTKTRKDSRAADLQILFGPCYYQKHGFDPPAGHRYSIGPTLISPRSRGQIALRSRSPFNAPVIRANYLSDEADMRVLIEGVKISRRIGEARAFAPFRGTETHPGAVVKSDEEIEASIRTTAETLYHPVGTCKMGTDAMAVVGPQLRVIGVDGLRVADASVMPEIVAGNTNAPVGMIAEKAADVIRQAA